MKDPKKILIQQTSAVALPRQVRFTELKEVAKLKTTIKSYIKDAIIVEEAGVELPKKIASEVNIPADIQAKMRKIPGLSQSFKKLTPGRQRAWILHFTSAKQEATTIARIQKASQAIFDGKGFNE